MKKMISILTIVAMAMTVAFAAPQTGDVSLNINGTVSTKIAHKFSSKKLNAGDFAGTNPQEISEKTLDMTSTVNQHVGYYNLFTNWDGGIEVTAKASTLKAANASDIKYTMNGKLIDGDNVEISNFVNFNKGNYNKYHEATVYVTEIVLALDSDTLVLAAGNAHYSADLTVAVKAI